MWYGQLVRACEFRLVARVLPCLAPRRPLKPRKDPPLLPIQQTPTGHGKKWLGKHLKHTSTYYHCKHSCLGSQLTYGSRSRSRRPLPNTEPTFDTKHLGVGGRERKQTNLIPTRSYTDLPEGRNTTARIFAIPPRCPGGPISTRSLQRCTYHFT